MRNKSLFDGYKELKIVNIESLFFAFLLGFTLKETSMVSFLSTIMPFLLLNVTVIVRLPLSSTL